MLLLDDLVLDGNVVLELIISVANQKTRQITSRFALGFTHVCKIKFVIV